MEFDTNAFSDINECTENPNICPEGQWCVNFQGGHVCCSHGASISRCQGDASFTPSAVAGIKTVSCPALGLVIGIWNKKDKMRKKTTGTPIFDRGKHLCHQSSGYTICICIVSETSPTTPTTTPFPTLADSKTSMPY